MPDDRKVRMAAVPDRCAATIGGAQLAELLKERAHELGFDLVGIAPAVRPDGFHRLVDWIDAGFAGEMHYVPRRRGAYEDPAHVLAAVRSVVMVAVNYRTESVPHEPRPGDARVASYARGECDYHDLLRRRLHELADVLHEHRPGARTRVAVDTAPLLERDFARLAGIGWFGKNTMLINKRAGSWLLLGALLTDVELPADAPHQTAHCGTCTRCLDACPTDAFVEPYVLDARRCISYLTIELRQTPIPRDLREGLGDWLFGCDICQDVCPWNRKAPGSNDPVWQPRDDLHPARAAELLTLTNREFEERFSATPLARPGRAALLRNAATVIGNTGDRRFVDVLSTALSDDAHLVRGACAWALGQVGGTEALHALKRREDVETDPEVQTEIRRALARILGRPQL